MSEQLDHKQNMHEISKLEKLVDLFSAESRRKGEAQLESFKFIVRLYADSLINPDIRLGSIEEAIRAEAVRQYNEIR